MKCYLCEANSDIETKTDGFLVHCSGACGPYIITQIALHDLSRFTAENKVPLTA